MADFESVDGRNGSRETGANLDRICCFHPFQVWSKGKRDRDQKRCAVAETKKSPQNPWTESWFSRAKRENGSAKNVWSRGRSWGKKFWQREILTSLLNRSNRSLNLNDFRYIKQVDGQSRLKEIKISLYGEFELRNGLFKENHARDCLGNRRNAKTLLRRNRSSKTSKTWCIVDASRDESNDCESILDSNFGFTEQSKFLVWENVTILKQRAALEHPTFPFNSLPFWVPEPCLASILDCRMIHGILWVLQETFLNDHLFKKYDPPKSSPILKTFGIILSGSWDLKLQEVQGEESEMKREPLKHKETCEDHAEVEYSQVRRLERAQNSNPWKQDNREVSSHLYKHKGTCVDSDSKDCVSQHEVHKPSIHDEGLPLFQKKWGMTAGHSTLSMEARRQDVLMGECACFRRWKPPSILGRIIWRIRRCTTTRTSREFRAHPISHRMILEHSEEILNVHTIKSASLSWTRWVLSHDQVTQWTGKSMCLCCFPYTSWWKWKIAEMQRWVRKVKWKNSFSLLTKNCWESMDKQVNSSGIFSQDFGYCRFSKISRLNIDSEKFTDRIIFMSMFNDIAWARKGKDGICVSNFEKKKKNLARTLDVSGSLRRKEVVWNSSFWTWKKLDSTATEVVERFKDTGLPVFKTISALSRGILKTTETQYTSKWMLQTQSSDSESFIISAQYLRSSFELV